MANPRPQDQKELDQEEALRKKAVAEDELEEDAEEDEALEEAEEQQLAHENDEHKAKKQKQDQEQEEDEAQQEQDEDQVAHEVQQQATNSAPIDQQDVFDFAALPDDSVFKFNQLDNDPELTSIDKSLAIAEYYIARSHEARYLATNNRDALEAQRLDYLYALALLEQSKTEANLRNLQTDRIDAAFAELNTLLVLAQNKLSALNDANAPQDVIAHYGVDAQYVEVSNARAAIEHYLTTGKTDDMPENGLTISSGTEDHSYTITAPSQTHVSVIYSVIKDISNKPRFVATALAQDQQGKIVTRVFCDPTLKMRDMSFGRLIQQAMKDLLAHKNASKKDEPLKLTGSGLDAMFVKAYMCAAEILRAKGVQIDVSDKTINKTGKLDDYIVRTTMQAALARIKSLSPQEAQNVYMHNTDPQANETRTQAVNALRASGARIPSTQDLRADSDFNKYALRYRPERPSAHPQRATATATNVSNANTHTSGGITSEANNPQDNPAVNPTTTPIASPKSTPQSPAPKPIVAAPNPNERVSEELNTILLQADELLREASTSRSLNYDEMIELLMSMDEYLAKHSLEVRQMYDNFSAQDIARIADKSVNKIVATSGSGKVHAHPETQYDCKMDALTPLERLLVTRSRLLQSMYQQHGTGQFKNEKDWQLADLPHPALMDSWRPLALHTPYVLVRNPNYKRITVDDNPRGAVAVLNQELLASRNNPQARYIPIVVSDGYRSEPYLVKIANGKIEEMIVSESGAKNFALHFPNINLTNVQVHTAFTVFHDGNCTRYAERALLRFETLRLQKNSEAAFDILKTERPLTKQSKPQLESELTALQIKTNWLGYDPVSGGLQPMPQVLVERYRENLQQREDEENEQAFAEGAGDVPLRTMRPRM